MRFTRVLLFVSMLFNTLFFTNVQARSLDVAAAAFAAPTLLAPAQGSIPPIIRPVFDWSDVPGATRYELNVSIYSNYNWMSIISNVSASSFTSTDDLPRNVTVYWRVRVSGPSFGPWATGSFVAPNPPYSPWPISPGLGAVVTNYIPTLTWISSPTPLPAGTTFAYYQLQVSASNTFASLMVDQQLLGTSYTFAGSLAPNTPYYWRIRAVNTLNQYSMWRTSFFNTALLPPTLLAPASQSVASSLHPMFDWSDVPGNAGYGLQVSLVPDFSSWIITLAVSDSTYTPTLDLPSKTVIYWRVRTHGANLSAWSTSSFTTP